MKKCDASDEAVNRYMAEVRRYPLLSREEEAELARRYRYDGAEDAAHRLAACNLRFVVKTAHQYRGYGFKLLDLIQEGNIGLLVAIKKFDPDKGHRLVSYAVWWIRAYIQAYIMRSWSLVKVGTTQAQRKLFYRLRSEREKADRALEPGCHATAKELADQLGVGESDVVGMEARMMDRDFSLDAKLQDDGQSSHLDFLCGTGDDQEQRLGSQQMRELLRAELSNSMSELNDKERYVVENRLLIEDPPTLQEIGMRLNVSRERVRQLEGNVVRRLRTAFARHGIELNAA